MTSLGIFAMKAQRERLEATGCSTVSGVVAEARGGIGMKALATGLIFLALAVAQKVECVVKHRKPLPPRMFRAAWAARPVECTPCPRLL